MVAVVMPGLMVVAPVVVRLRFAMVRAATAPLAAVLVAVVALAAIPYSTCAMCTA